MYIVQGKHKYGLAVQIFTNQARAWIHHCNHLRIPRVITQYSVMSILSPFHWFFENSKPRVFSIIICPHLNVNKAVNSKFMLVYLSTQVPTKIQMDPGIRNTQGFVRNGAKSQQILRVTLGYPEYCHWNSYLCDNYNGEFNLSARSVQIYTQLHTHRTVTVVS